VKKAILRLRKYWKSEKGVNSDEEGGIGKRSKGNMERKRGK